MESMPFNVMDHNCPSRVVLQRIGDKWTPLIFQALKGGARRFGEIRQTVDGVSPKVLTQSLRALERDGLVTREVFAEVPVRVEYALTALGESLLEPLDAVRIWAEAHAARILAARDAYDESSLRAEELTTA
ncbi:MULTISPECIES: helix-turn-helix domain-containing protein [Arthrobacter]|uniref:Helix-turn-helix domain-containing protein n=2 Tax=Arthrobacter TaxID=1663 RepID=A0ABU9KK82_9MICC|nr:helix-turn-helix domain-containing protein [Arthrobacter sp. YJM1]MDP5226660.1 helix-turn-helix domain-containing protein [Arthrobacter sp. YJM1]